MTEEENKVWGLAGKRARQVKLFASRSGDLSSTQDPT